MRFSKSEIIADCHHLIVALLLFVLQNIDIATKKPSFFVGWKCSNILTTFRVQQFCVDLFFFRK